jgi:ribosomal-protein-alanine N-acetyltransferase
MPDINFQPFPVLYTDRLVLREIVEADTPAVFEIRSNPSLMRYVPRPMARNHSDALEVVNMIAGRLVTKEGINWGICLKDDPTVIGIIGYVRIWPERFRAEIGYILHGDFHGKGVMQEALLEAIRYGFEDMGLHSIEAVVNPENKASSAILLRNGFSLSGFFKDLIYFDGKFIDANIYSLIDPGVKP